MSLDTLAILLSFPCLAIFVLSIPPQWSSGLYFGHDLSVANHIQNSSLSPRQISATERGEVYVVWVDKNNIYFSANNHSGNKFAPAVLLSDTNKSSSSPQLAANEKGNVYVVWVDIDNKTGDSNIMFRTSNDSGKSFSTQKELEGGKFISISPQLAANEKGNVYVVWVDKNNKTGDRNVEFISSNDSGMTFHDRKKLTGGKPISFFPQLAANEKGNVYLVWVDKNNKTGDTDIVFRSSNDSGMSFDDRKKIRRSDSLLSFSPQIAATENGNVYLVWVDKNSTSGDTDISFRSSSDSGRDFERIINLDKGEKKVSSSSLPQIATAQNDSVYVIWVNNQIQFKELLVKDAIVGNPISLSSKGTSSQSAEITGTKNGNLYVLWIDKNDMMDGSLHFKRISQNYFDRNS
jgi:hypothetical protein